MNTGIIFALLSMLFAGINDVIFKRYSTEDRSRGIYVFGIGVIWTVLQTAYLGYKGIQLDSGIEPTLFYGSIAGFLLVCSNILLLESLKKIDTSLGSTIYRLNTIVVVFLSIIFLNEIISSMKLIGISLGIIAVMLLFKSNKNLESHVTYSTFLWIAVTASVFRGLYGVISKAGLLNGASAETMLLIASFFWVIGGIAYALLREKRFKVTRIKVKYSIISGILVFLIVNTLIAGLQIGEASIIIPIANLSFLVALTLSVIMKMEVLNKFKLIAISFSVLAIIFLSWT